MRSLMTVVSVLALSVGTAFASSGTDVDVDVTSANVNTNVNSPHYGDYKPTNTNNNQDTNVNAVSSTSQATNRNDIDNRSSVSHSGNSTNVNVLDNEQYQGQYQGQHQSTKSSAKIEDSANNSVTITENHPRQNPGAMAPSMIGAGGNGDSCTQMQSAGFSNSFLGLALGISHDEDDCNRRKDARHLWDMGFKDAARERMCQDSDTREAMLTAGTPCNADKPQVVAVTAPGEEVIAYRPMEPIKN